MTDNHAIARLADRVEAICTGLTEAERRVKAAGIAAELRQLAQQGKAEGFVLVRKEAIDWLNGESDFECPPERYFRGEPPRYWWRSVFREKAGLTAA